MAAILYPPTLTVEGNVGRGQVRAYMVRETELQHGAILSIIEAISSIKAAIDKSAADKSDSPWQNAASAAGLAQQPDKGGVTRIDQD